MRLVLAGSFRLLRLRAPRAVVTHQPARLSRATPLPLSEYADASYLWEPLEMLRTALLKARYDRISAVRAAVAQCLALMPPAAVAAAPAMGAAR